MLVWCICEYMVSIININNDIKEPPRSIKTEIPVKYGCWVGFVKLRESLYTRILIWVETILNILVLGRFSLGMKGSCMLYRLEWYRQQKYPQIPYWHQVV